MRQLATVILLALAIGLVLHHEEAPARQRRRRMSSSVEAVMTYSDAAEARVRVRPRDVDSQGDQFLDGIFGVRGAHELAEWVKGADLDEIDRHGIDADDPWLRQLAVIVARIAARADRKRLQGHSFKGQLGSVIARPHHNGYASVCHRDLDEIAVANLRKAAHRPSQRWYNAWIPLTPVRSQPLGLIAASSVDFSEAAGYHRSLEGDRTGIKYNASHRWIWFPDLGPGDVILWHSERVYHSSFDLPEGPLASSGSSSPRRSLDIRLYFEAGVSTGTSSRPTRGGRRRG